MFILTELFCIIGAIYFFYSKLGLDHIGAYFMNNFSSYIPMVQNIHYRINKGWEEPWWGSY
jgi:E3 ubiquitin-protein ligase DOA10